MNIWNQIPFLRLLLPFLCGILVAIYTGFQINSLEYILLGLFLIITLFIVLKRLNFSYNYSWIFGTLATVALFLCGFKVTVMNTEKFYPDHFSKFPDAELYKVKTNSTNHGKRKVL